MNLYNRKGIILGVIVCCFIFVFVFAGILYARVFDPQWNPFRSSPEKVVTTMLQAMKMKRAASINIVVKATYKKDDKDLYKVSLSVKGSGNYTDKDNLKTQGDFEGNVSTEGISYTVSGEYKVGNNNIYVKLTTIPAYPLLSLFWGDVDLKNQWIRVEQKDYSSPFSKTEVEALKAKVQNILNSSTSAYYIEALQDERVNKEMTYHYQITLAHEMLLKIFKAIPKKEQSSPSFEDVINKIGDVPFEIWVGNKDMLLRRILLQKDFNLHDFNFGIDGVVSAKMQAEFLDYGKQIVVELPKDSKTFNEILESASKSSSLGVARMNARDARRKADIRIIQIALELYYNDTNKYLQKKTAPTIELSSSAPKDPSTNLDYGWVNNTATGTNTGQSYCLYALLEKASSIKGNHLYFVVDPKGARQLDQASPPTRTPCN